MTTTMRLIATAALAVMLSACATSHNTAVSSDPLENMNRKVFNFNQSVDKNLIKPVADSYKAVMPDPLESGVSNFFQNLGSVNVIANDLLQGKFRQGLSDTLRFATNSTLGLFGLFDVATGMGLEQHREDFGQTLAVWGLESGPYMVLPFLGPTTLRNTTSLAVGAVTDPVVLIYPPLLGLQAVDARARAESSLKVLNETAIDPYIFTREAYLQWRNHLVYDGNPPVDEDFLELAEEF